MTRPRISWLSLALVAIATAACAVSQPVATNRPLVPGQASAPVPAGNPLAQLSSNALLEGEAIRLPEQVTTGGGDWGMPPRTSNPITWRIAQEDAEKARLDGTTLTPLKPGGLRMIATSGSYTVWVYYAVRSAALSESIFTGGPMAPALKVSPLPFVIQDAAAWRQAWEDAYRPSQESLDQMKAVPTGPPPPPPAPDIDFSKRSVVVATVDGRRHSRYTIGFVVTNLENGVLQVVQPDVWDPDKPSPAPTVVPSGQPVAEEDPSDREDVRVVFNVPKVPAQVEVRQERFVAPAR